jgi:hypothetical protein
MQVGKTKRAQTLTRDVLDETEGVCSFREIWDGGWDGLSVA